MTREEAKTVFLNRGYVEVEGGTIYDADKWRESCRVISEWLEQEPCDDCISRQAVQDYIAKYLSQYLYDDVREVAEVIDEYIGDLPSVKPQEPQTEWIPIEWKLFGKNGYPKPEDEYKHFLTIDDKGEITIQEFLLSLDEEPQPYFTGMRKIIAWMPLPKPYLPDTNDGKLSENPTGSKDVIWYSKRNYSEIVVEPQESEVV